MATYDTTSTTYTPTSWTTSTDSNSTWNMSFSKSTWTADKIWTEPIKKKEITVTTLDFHIFMKHKQEFDTCMACLVIEKYKEFEHLKKNTKQDPLEELLVSHEDVDKPNSKPEAKIDDKTVMWKGKYVKEAFIDDPLINPPKEKFVSQPGHKIVSHAVISGIAPKDINENTEIDMQAESIKQCDTHYPDTECKCGAIEIEWNVFVDTNDPKKKLKYDPSKTDWDIVESKIPKWE